jgi:hypothetical protein
VSLFRLVNTCKFAGRDRKKKKELSECSSVSEFSITPDTIPE